MLLTTALRAPLPGRIPTTRLDAGCPRQGTAATTVEVARSITGLTSLPARIAFDDRKLATMGAPVPGRVLHVDVEVGRRVDEGALLLTVLSPDVAAANAQLGKATRARAAAEHSAEWAGLLPLNSARTRPECQHASSALEKAKAEERAARAVLTAFGASPDSNEYQLKSPIAGVVVEQNVSVGSQVDTDSELPLISVADLSTLWVITHVDELHLPLVHTGDEARVRVPIFPGRDWSGMITYIGETIDSSTDTAVARIEIQNSDSSLHPGMVATVDILANKKFNPRNTP